jgi:hypothetical protein
MKKLILFAAALLLAGQATAYAQGDHATRHQKRLMSSHAQVRGYDYGRVRTYDAPVYVSPGYGGYGAYGGYGGGMDDQAAEGRTGG